MRRWLPIYTAGTSGSVKGQYATIVVDCIDWIGQMQSVIFWGHAVLVDRQLPG